MKKRFFLLAVLAFIFATATYSQAYLQQKAEELFASGNYSGAQTLYKQLMREFPNDGHIADGYANCLFEQGHYARAIRSYKKAAALHQKSGEENAKEFMKDSLVMCGESYLAKKKTKKAFKEFSAVYQMDAADENALLGIVASCMRLGYEKEASDFCERFIHQYGSNYEALAHLYFYWSQCQYALGKKEQAAAGILVARENYIKAGLFAPEDELERLYTLFVSE